MAGTRDGALVGTDVPGAAAFPHTLHWNHLLIAAVIMAAQYGNGCTDEGEDTGG